MYELIFQSVRENIQALKASQLSLRAKVAETRDSNGNGISISQQLPDADYSLSEIDVAISSFTSFVEARIAENESEIKRLLNESEGMLRGATNAGLAASFSSLQSKINSELRWARYSFYFSILLLVGLSMPIALYVFPGLHALFSAITGIDAGMLVPKNVATHATPEVIAQVAARALLLIPGIWLVRFTSARHERLFRLREHYAYKYSVASSVEGFKKQAPDLQQGIAAATFYELTFNPATRMDANSSETRHPNPVMEYVMKKLGGDGAK